MTHRYALKNLNLLGEDMHYVPLEEIGIMRNLRTVGLSAVKNYGSVTPSQFEDFAPSLEELNLVDSGITSIDRHAFKFVPSVSSMDLSNNRIEYIADDAFREVGNALQYLRLSNTLYFTRLPNKAFRSLTGLKTLDLSNNHIRKVPLDSFHKMTRLEYLYLQVGNEIVFQNCTLFRKEDEFNQPLFSTARITKYQRSSAAPFTAKRTRLSQSLI